MTRRLFGDGGSGLIVTEQRRQGLYQIFHHCCNGESGIAMHVTISRRTDSALSAAM
jgi:hypothetical protein